MKLIDQITDCFQQPDFLLKKTVKMYLISYVIKELSRVNKFSCQNVKDEFQMEDLKKVQLGEFSTNIESINVAIGKITKILRGFKKKNHGQKLLIPEMLKLANKFWLCLQPRLQ